MNFDFLQFDDSGLIPAVIQDIKTGSVLMVAYMNREALEKTIATGYTCFFSRSRQKIWQKGETSGNVQKVIEISYDCDADTLLIKVEQTGTACHEGNYSCFSRILVQNPAKTGNYPQNTGGAVQELNELYAVINERRQNAREGSYTAYLFNSGQDKILKKVGEEAAETIIASKNNNNSEVVYEMADLWYHCMVLLAYHNITPEALLAELKSRRK